MSFELYLQCHDNGEDAGVSLEAVRHEFGEYLTALDASSWRVVYDDLNSCDIHFSTLADDATKVHSLAVFRPCGDSRLWDALLKIMRMGNVVMYFPGNCPPLVAHERVRTHLPAEMLESLGEPIVVASGQEIIERIESA